MVLLKVIDKCVNKHDALHQYKSVLAFSSETKQTQDEKLERLNHYLGRGVGNASSGSGFVPPPMESRFAVITRGGEYYGFAYSAILATDIGIDFDESSKCHDGYVTPAFVMAQQNDANAGPNEGHRAQGIEQPNVEASSRDTIQLQREDVNSPHPVNNWRDPQQMTKDAVELLNRLKGENAELNKHRLDQTTVLFVLDPPFTPGPTAEWNEFKLVTVEHFLTPEDLVTIESAGSLRLLSKVRLVGFDLNHSTNTIPNSLESAS
jgi:hypothetical protein